MDSKKSVCRSRSCTFRRVFFNRKGGGGARDKRREALGHVFYRHEREDKKNQGRLFTVPPAELTSSRQDSKSSQLAEVISKTT